MEESKKIKVFVMTEGYMMECLRSNFRRGLLAFLVLIIINKLVPLDGILEALVLGIFFSIVVVALESYILNIPEATEVSQEDLDKAKGE